MRLPSFNDFSPGILKNDIRTILGIVFAHQKNNEAIIEALGSHLQWQPNRVKNIIITLRATELAGKESEIKLTAFGERVKDAPTPKEAAAIFCSELINKQNGLKLIDAVKTLNARKETITKVSLQNELKRMGITNLANDTTDHYTLKNWMIEAGILNEPSRGVIIVNDAELKSLVGISSSEHDELEGLTPAQRIFLVLLRKRHEVEDGPFNGAELRDECNAEDPEAFGRADFAKSVTKPLVAAGWIEVEERKSEGRGGKSGWISGSKKLLSIPIQRVIPDFDSIVPSDLRSKLRTPLSTIREWLAGSDTHKGGLALELLALRVILDLRLEPRDFRLRSKDTAYAEVDVTAEGAHLMFSRWTFQCKRIQPDTRVGLGDVAKEVGIAIYMKAHVIVMVSTGGFSREALNYAREISRATHLQFIFLDGNTIEEYLARGAPALLSFIKKNASEVMIEKRGQPISTNPM